MRKKVWTTPPRKQSNLRPSKLTPMLTRLGWIGIALATGLLLQIVVQIRWLQWLPDFPIYPALAMLASAVALFAMPLAALRGGRPAWTSGAVFVALAIAHAALAAVASSSALEWWRDVVLWPALVAGIAACALTAPRRPITPLAIWCLGEAAVTILACWYAPSRGESYSLRAYQYVLIGGLATVAFGSPRLWLEQMRWITWFYGLTLVVPQQGMLVTCLLLSDPDQAQGILLGLSALRFVLFASAQYLLAASDATTTGEVESSPVL